MQSENVSLLEMQGQLTTINRENLQTLLTQQNTEREKNKNTNQPIKNDIPTAMSPSKKIIHREKNNSDKKNPPAEKLGRVKLSPIQNLKQDGEGHEFTLEQQSNYFKSATKIRLSIQQQPNLQGGVVQGSAVSNQSSNFLASPSNTFLNKENEDTMHIIDPKLMSDGGGGQTSRAFIQKIDSDICQQKQSNHTIQEETPNVLANTQSARSIPSFMEKLTLKSRTKTFSSFLPTLFNKSGGLTKLNTIVPEKSVESNLSKMVRFVKLKKQAVEMKRFFVKSQHYKNIMSQFSNPFFKILDDISANSIDNNNTAYFFLHLIRNLKLYQILVKLAKYIPVIEPSSKFKLVWDLIIGTVFMTYFFVIPIHVAINVSIHELITPYVGYTLHLMMLIDIVFSMVTGYFEKGVNINNKKKIFIQYIKYYFWSDAIAQIPLLISELGNQDSQVEKVFVLLFFVKLRNFQKIFRKFEDSFHLTPKTSNIISLIKLILNILFFSHIFGCIWLFIGLQQYHQNQTNWMRKIFMEDDIWANQYIAAYYFSTVTMITVGYGDIVPSNNLERVVSVGTMLISCVIFAYTISQIGQIFSDLFSQDRQMKEFFYIINDYMDNKNINFSLQYRIREYLDYYWREQDQNKSDLEKKIIESLSDNLREKLMVEANRIVFKDYGIFSANFNSSIILKMIPIIQILHTTPNQIIFSEGQLDDDMFIYFVEKGNVEICREQDSETNDGEKIQKKIVSLGPGSCFGAYSFFTNQDRKEMARSLGFSKLLMIRRSDFLQLISDMPQEIEKFNNIKDAIIFENNHGFLEVRCQCCQSYNHEIQHCHYFHYSPDKYIVIKKDNKKYLHQPRDSKFYRKRIVTFGFFAQSKEHNKAAEKWRNENAETIDYYYQEYLMFDELYREEFSQEDEYDEDALKYNSSEDSVYENDDEDTESYYYEDNSVSINDGKKSKQKKQDSIINEEGENEQNSSYQMQKNNTIKQMNQELNMSIVNSTEIQDTGQYAMQKSYQNQEAEENEDNVRQRKRQITSIFNQMHLSKLIEQDESLPSQNNLTSEKGSSGLNTKNFDKALNLLGQEARNESQRSPNLFQKRNDSIQQSNRSIKMDSSITGKHGNEIYNSPDAHIIKRAGFKQLTVMTNSDLGSVRTINKIPLATNLSPKALKRQETLQMYDREISIGQISDQEFSPQLIFIADIDKFELNKKSIRQEPGKDRLILDSKSNFDDFNIEKEEKSIIKNAGQTKQSRDAVQYQQQNNFNKQNQQQSSIVNIREPALKNSENNNSRKLRKEKSVKINSFNEDTLKRKSSQRSQTLISNSQSEIKSSKRISFSNITDGFNQDINSKRRKSSRSREFNDLFLKASENQNKLYYEQQSPVKRCKEDQMNRERRKSRTTQNGFEMQRNITLTEQMIQNEIVPPSSDKNQRKSCQHRFGEYEIKHSEIQNTYYSPSIKRRSIEKIENLKPQSFKNLGIFASRSASNQATKQGISMIQSHQPQKFIHLMNAQHQENSEQDKNCNNQSNQPVINLIKNGKSASKIGQNLINLHQHEIHFEDNNHDRNIQSIKDSQVSEESTPYGENDEKGKKRILHSKDKSKVNLPSQSSFKKNKTNMTTQDTQNVSPSSRNPNLLFPGVKGQKQDNNSPLSALPSPRQAPSSVVKNNVFNFIQKAKIASQLNRSNNESLSSQQKSKQGDQSPKSTMSIKKQQLYNLNMMNKIESQEELNFLQRKNLIDQQNIINQRKLSGNGVNMTNSISQFRQNFLGVGKSGFRLNEIGTPLMKGSSDINKNTVSQYQKQYTNMKMQQLPQVSSSNYDQQIMNNNNNNLINVAPISNQSNQFQNLQGSHAQQQQLQLQNQSESANYQQTENDLETLFIIMAFDELKQFQHYFPKGNYQRVIAKANKIISKQFTKFIKILKKSKANKRKEEQNTKENRRGSYFSKKPILMKKKSNGFETPNVSKQNTKNRSGSDDKIGKRNRVNSFALNRNNLEESLYSQGSDLNNNKHSQKDSPKSKEFIPIRLNSEATDKNIQNVVNLGQFDSKRALSPIQKSIFNRQNVQF